MKLIILFLNLVVENDSLDEPGLLHLRRRLCNWLYDLCWSWLKYEASLNDLCSKIIFYFI